MFIFKTRGGVGCMRRIVRDRSQLNLLRGYSTELKPTTTASTTTITTTSTTSSSSATTAFTPPSTHNLIGLSQLELKGLISTVYPAIQNFNIEQLWRWLYYQGTTDFSTMLNLPKPLRETLQKEFFASYGKVETHLTSLDGTIKRLIEFDSSAHDKPSRVEAVLIPESKRRTLCVSSQVGCSLNCSFCHTGTQKLLRNLTAGEIVGQYMGFAHLLKEFPMKPLNRRKVSNIVFMGQGEPLYNHRNVFKAIKVLTDETGLGFPKNKITVSTSGVVPVIPRLASDLGVNLAVSLHAVTDNVRDEIVPLNKQFNIKSLMESCHTFVKKSSQATQRITFEYVMLKGVNDSLKDAQELVRLIRKLPCHVNLIPFNPWPGCDYECTDLDQIRKFANEIYQRNVPVNIRFSRGQDIMAACGQLKSLNMTKSKLAQALEIK